MLKGLIGMKIGMTQIFSEDGERIPVTVIQAGPCTVVQKKTAEKEGYNALQMGFLPQKEKRVKKPQLGHFRKANVPPFRFLKEFRIDAVDEYAPGSVITVEIFRKGDRVDVTGVSKGRGFAGVMKRWGFGGGPAAHGSMFHRAPGSVGATTDPGRTIKGKKLPGHMGMRRVTVKNLKVIDVKPDENLLLVKGAVPGPNKGIVYIKA